MVFLSHQSIGGSGQLDRPKNITANQSTEELGEEKQTSYEEMEKEPKKR